MKAISTFLYDTSKWKKDHLCPPVVRGALHTADIADNSYSKWDLTYVQRTVAVPRTVKK